MRCKKHLSDLSSTVGVCASCLRGRLFILIEQQSKSPIQFQSNTDNSNPNFIPKQNLHKKQPQQPPQQQPPQQQQPPPPLIFPRSVSPYISRRKSEPIQRFYSTPQVIITNDQKTKKKQNSGKFGFVKRLFRSKSSSSSTNSTFISTHNSIVINRGMSPENELESVESSPARWINRPSPARVRPSPARAASMAFCLSPLVRASPARNWGTGGGGGEKAVCPGEIRVTVNNGKFSSSNDCNNNSNKPYLGEAASFSSNRSRKLADFGRFNLKR